MKMNIKKDRFLAKYGSTEHLDEMLAKNGRNMPMENYRNIVSNPNFNRSHHDQLTKYPEDIALSKLVFARSPFTGPEDITRVLSTHGDGNQNEIDSKFAALMHKNVKPEHYVLAMHDPSYRMRAVAALHSKNPATQEIAVNDPHSYVRKSAAMSRHVTKAQLEKLSTDENEDVAQEASRNLQTWNIIK